MSGGLESIGPRSRIRVGNAEGHPEGPVSVPRQVRAAFSAHRSM